MAEAFLILQTPSQEGQSSACCLGTTQSFQVLRCRRMLCVYHLAEDLWPPRCSISRGCILKERFLLCRKDSLLIHIKKKKWQHGKGKSKIKIPLLFRMQTYSNRTFRSLPSTVLSRRYFAGGTDTLPCCPVCNLLSVALEEQRLCHIEGGIRPCQNANDLTNACLRTFLVTFLPTASHIWVQHGSCAGAVKSRRDYWTARQSCRTESQPSTKSHS